MPIHPLCGQQLRLMGPGVVQAGTRYLIVEHPKGRRYRIPEAWSDRVVTLPAPTVSGQTVRLAAKALLRLSQAVAASLDRKLDKRPTGDTLARGLERCSHAAVERSATTCATVVHPSTTNTGAVAGDVGDTDAQDASVEAVLDGGRS
jgi:hypothetical protein